MDFSQWNQFCTLLTGLGINKDIQSRQDLVEVLDTSFRKCMLELWDQLFDLDAAPSSPEILDDTEPTPVVIAPKPPNPAVILPLPPVNVPPNSPPVLPALAPRIPTALQVAPIAVPHPPQLPSPSLPIAQRKPSLTPSPPTVLPTHTTVLPPVQAPMPPPQKQAPSRPPGQASASVSSRGHSQSFSYGPHSTSAPLLQVQLNASAPEPPVFPAPLPVTQSQSISNQSPLPPAPAPSPPPPVSPVATPFQPTPPPTATICNNTASSQPILSAAQASPSPSYNASSTIVRYFENPYSCGLLQLKVLRGFDLRLGGTRKPNPFCVIHKVSDPPNTGKRLKSKSFFQESEPVWEEEFQIEMPNSADADIQIDVFSHNRFFSSDEFLGKIILLDVRRIKNFEGKQRLESDSSTGSLSVSYQYVPTNDRNVNYRIAREYESNLITFLSHPGLVLPSSICDTMIADDSVAVTITRLLNRDGSTMMLVLSLLKEDIGTATQQTQNTLFRANSPATKLLAHYFKLIGYQYLVQTLQPLISTLVADPSHCEVEADKMSPDESIDENAKKLAAIIQNLVVAVCNSVEAVPSNIKTVLRQVKIRLDELRHPSNIAVVALFFLRFVVPAIINPEQYYLASVDEVKPETRRALSLVGRVFQWLVNLKSDGTSEDKVFVVVKPYFTFQLRSILEVFISKLMDSTVGPADQPHSVLSAEDYIKLLAILVNKMVSLEQAKRMQLEAKFDQRLKQANFPKSEKKVLKQQFSQMMTILFSSNKAKMP
ncbi:RasGTPase-activating protein [Pelomyxa schiedti]|nr:RasGTPase-activating protein [Pelomyxa schiedti]